MVGVTADALDVIVCEFCNEPIAESDRFPAEDHYMDHLTEEHQDRLPNSYIDGGAA